MIQFTKKYAVNHENGIYKILLAKHEDDIVYGSIIYHTANPNNPSGVVEAKIETLPGGEEEDVLSDCINWIRQHLPGEVEVRIIFE